MPPWDLPYPLPSSTGRSTVRQCQVEEGCSQPSEGHNQALVCSQTAQVLWLLAPNPGDPLTEPLAWEDDAGASVRDRAAFVYRPLAMALRTPHPPAARSELQERKLHEPEGLME